MVSALNPINLNFAGIVDEEAIVSQGADFTDPVVRQGRQLAMVSSSSFSNEQCLLRAQWEASIRRTRSKTYSVAVDGFYSSTGSLWEVNTLVPVVDEFAGIDSKMLINTVSMTQDLTSEDGGSITVLGLVPQDSYKLTLSEPKAEKVGDGLFS
jgi:prophage tail gpP-like protein